MNCCGAEKTEVFASVACSCGAELAQTLRPEKADETVSEMAPVGPRPRLRPVLRNLILSRMERREQPKRHGASVAAHPISAKVPLRMTRTERCSVFKVILSQPAPKAISGVFHR